MQRECRCRLPRCLAAAPEPAGLRELVIPAWASDCTKGGLRAAQTGLRRPLELSSASIASEQDCRRAGRCLYALRWLPRPPGCGKERWGVPQRHTVRGLRFPGL